MKKFCVIGATANSGGFKRTWAETQEGAVEFAKGIAREQYQRTGKPISLLIAEVKAVVEVGVPEVIARDPTAGDTGGEEEAEDPEPAASEVGFQLSAGGHWIRHRGYLYRRDRFYRK